MCQYTYSYYYCGHDYFILSDAIEYCGNRNLAADSVDLWGSDVCNKAVVTCNGMSYAYCSECSEDHTLEFELDDWICDDGPTIQLSACFLFHLQVYRFA